MPDLRKDNLADSLPLAKKPRKWVILPGVGYTPETNWLGGFEYAYIYHHPGADTAATRTSLIQADGAYTILNQYVGEFFIDHWFNRERYFLHGENLIARFSYHYYGIGKQAREENDEVYRFDGVDLLNILYRQLKGKWYAGLGYRFVRYADFVLEPGGGLQTLRPLGIDGNSSSGIIASLLFDSRDNLYTPHRGHFVSVRAAQYANALGSTFNYSNLRGEWRYYLNHVFTIRKQDVLAFNAIAQANFGEVPFMELARVGTDQIMRGYYPGRYRDRHYLAAQVEYRYPLFWRIGIALFAGGGKVVPDFRQFDFTNWLPTYGGGLRYRIIKKKDLNVRFDYGFGNNTSNYYLEVAESF